MNPLFVRFGLPWLIFGSAIFALYWAIFCSEGMAYFDPVVEISRQASSARSSIGANVIPSKPRQARTEQVAERSTGDVASTTLTLMARKATQDLPPTATSKIVASDTPPISADNIRTSLQDTSPANRLRALKESDEQGLPVPAHDLQQMAMSDRDAQVRRLAMTKFAQDPEADPSMVRVVAEAALRDGDAAIQAHARDMLEQLTQASRFNDEAPHIIAPNEIVE